MQERLLPPHGTDQHFLCDRRDVTPRNIEDRTDGQTPRTNQATAGEVVQVPVVRAQGPVKPDGMVETGVPEWPLL